MTDTKWLDFAGYLNGCIHQLDHQHCPFKKYAQMDQFQRLEYLLTISDQQANLKMQSCEMLQKECSPILVEKQETCWDLSLIT